MKRSEMLSMITDIVHETRRATMAWTSVEIAERLLNEIENKGMVPPKYELTDPGHFRGDAFTYSINEWEPE